MKLLTADKVAEMLQVKKSTFLQNYATRPDFPPRISVSKLRFWWKEEDILNWLEKQRERRHKMPMV